MYGVIGGDQVSNTKELQVFHLVLDFFSGISRLDEGLYRHLDSKPISLRSFAAVSVGVRISAGGNSRYEFLTLISSFSLFTTV